MKIIWQYDPQYKGLAFGPNHLSFQKYGCLLASLAMRLEIAPVELIKKLDGCFNDNGLICAAAAKVLGLKYEYQPGRVPVKNSIWETDHFKHFGYPQHFVLALGAYQIADPYDGRIKGNQYRIRSTRIFA